MDETPQFTDAVTCPICGARTPIVKMEVRVSRHTRNSQILPLLSEWRHFPYSKTR